ncbi:unnamed protein product [Strongylus vulgaris]|uniref:Uncharacterized protein n=1 Tax=Strongylus vulgaris TaxID=40348 RepID=A0A3P7JAU3_STRVU|nr:unnamed protein product [Strongylus vulgaris]
MRPLARLTFQHQKANYLLLDSTKTLWFVQAHQVSRFQRLLNLHQLFNLLPQAFPGMFLLLVLLQKCSKQANNREILPVGSVDEPFTVVISSRACPRHQLHLP